MDRQARRNELIIASLNTPVAGLRAGGSDAPGRGNLYNSSIIIQTRPRCQAHPQMVHPEKYRKETSRREAPDMRNLFLDSSLVPDSSLPFSAILPCSPSTFFCALCTFLHDSGVPVSQNNVVTSQKPDRTDTAC
jgi:hypothetical protein